MEVPPGAAQESCASKAHGQKWEVQGAWWVPETGHCATGKLGGEAGDQAGWAQHGLEEHMRSLTFSEDLRGVHRPSLGLIG